MLIPVVYFFGLDLGKMINVTEQENILCLIYYQDYFL